METTRELSMRVRDATDGASGQSVSVSTASAATTNTIGADNAVVYSTVECFVVRGGTPTATVATGQPIPANQLVRLWGFANTDKLAFIAASGSGTVYVRPDA